MYMVRVSGVSKISSANVTAMRPLTSRRGFLRTISTPCTKTYQRQGLDNPYQEPFQFDTFEDCCESQLLVDRNAEMDYYLQELS